MVGYRATIEAGEPVKTLAMKATINNNQIKYETDRGTLIKLPKSKKTVWVPSRLVYRHSWYSAVYLPNNFTFTLSDKSISGASLAPLLDGNMPQFEIEKHVPESRHAKIAAADDSLLR